MARIDLVEQEQLLERHFGKFGGDIDPGLMPFGPVIKIFTAPVDFGLVFPQLESEFGRGRSYRSLWQWL